MNRIEGFDQDQPSTEINLRTASIDELYDYTEDKRVKADANYIAGLKEKYGSGNYLAHVSLYDQYRNYSKKIPYYISASIYENILNVIADRYPIDEIVKSDREASRKGRTVFTAFNLRSILKAVHPFFTENLDVNNDLTQNAVLAINENAEKFHVRYPLKTQIFNTVEISSRRFLSREYGVPIVWVRKDEYKDIIQDVDEQFPTGSKGVGKETIDEKSAAISSAYNVQPFSVGQYMKIKNTHIPADAVRKRVDDNTLPNHIYKKNTYRELGTLVDGLTPKRKDILNDIFLRTRHEEKFVKNLVSLLKM